MKQLIFLLTCLLLGLQHSSAQETSISAGLNYVYASQWDKAIQTYNFTRPFLIERQPLLEYGTFLHVQRIFRSKKTWHSGIGINYSFICSRADNPNFESTLRAQLINFAYVLHQAEGAWISHVSFDVASSALISLQGRRVNSETIDPAENLGFAPGFGLGVNVKANYALPFSVRLSAFVALGYSHLLYDPFAESLLNQTTGLNGSTQTPLINGQIGLQWRWAASKKSDAGS